MACRYGILKTLCGTTLKFAIFLGCVILTLALCAIFVKSVRNGVFNVPRAWSHFSMVELKQARRASTFDGVLAYLSPCLNPWVKTSKKKAKDSGQHLSSRANNVSDKELYARAEKWVNGTEERRRKFSPFLPVMTIAEKAVMIKTWRAFHDTCHRHNISYFLVEGSLLGAIRHRGFIPWDDDLDVAVNVLDLVRLRRVLSCVPGFTLRVQNNMHWKFFAEDALIPPVKPPATTVHAKKLSSAKAMAEYAPELEHRDNVVIRFPFLDIFVTTDEDGFTRSLTQYLSPYVFYRSKDVYPLTLAPFEGYMAPVPRNGFYLATVSYDIEECVSPQHDYKQNGDRRGYVSFPCKALAQMYQMYNVQM